MPNFLSHPQDKYHKILNMAPSGAGKTGAIASLANAGYRCVIADLNGGLSVLSPYLTDEGAKNIYYHEFVDEIRTRKIRANAGGGNAQLGEMFVAPNPTAFPSLVSMMNNWTEKEESIDLGPIANLGADTFFILDDLTFLGAACMYYTLHVNNSEEGASQSDWGAAMNRQEGIIAKLGAASTKTNVLVNAHVHFRDDWKEDSIQGWGMPNALGKGLPPKIATYFNHVITMEVERGSNKRKITTITREKINLKTPGHDVPKEFPLELTTGGKATKGLHAYVEYLKNQQIKGN